MRTRCIVSRVAGEHYIRLQRRTQNSCRIWCPEALLQFDVVQKWSYIEKLAAMKVAVDSGVRYLLWMDVSFEPVARLEPLWAHIAEHGWFVARQGDAKLAEWTSDAALDRYGINRWTAESIDLCLSGLVGFDIQSQIGQTIMNEWAGLRDTFSGAHKNHPGQLMQEMWGNKFSGHVSDNPKVSGHRHDESALSFVLWKLGLEIECSRFINIDYGEGFIVGRNKQNEDGTYVR